ncbi:hypothetical protein ABPG74_009250 [Tetrahymena malaccensis]
MDTASNQNLPSKLKDFFDLNEIVGEEKQEINQLNYQFSIEEYQYLRNMLIANIKSQESSEMQKKLPDQQITCQRQDSKMQKMHFYNNIPISFQVNPEIDPNCPYLSKRQNELGEWEYRIQGYQEISSIQMIKLNPQKKYKLELEIKNSSNWQSFIGYISYYQGNVILGYQCRVFAGTEVILVGLDVDNKAFIVDDKNNLLNWNSPDQPNREKCIGIYRPGSTDGDFIYQYEVIVTDGKTAAYKRIDAENNKIYLTDWAWDYYVKNLHNQTILNQTVLKNHGDMNTYDYCKITNKHYKEWDKKFYDINKFRRFTDSIKICILGNYHGNQDEVFEFKNVQVIEYDE